MTVGVVDGDRDAEVEGDDAAVAKLEVDAEDDVRFRGDSNSDLVGIRAWEVTEAVEARTCSIVWNWIGWSKVPKSSGELREEGELGLEDMVGAWVAGGGDA